MVSTFADKNRGPAAKERRLRSLALVESDGGGSQAVEEDAAREVPVLVDQQTGPVADRAQSTGLAFEDQANRVMVDGPGFAEGEGFFAAQLATQPFEVATNLFGLFEGKAGRVVAVEAEKAE